MDNCYKLNEVIGLQNQAILYGTGTNIGLNIQLINPNPIKIQLEVGTICIPQNDQVQQMVVNSDKVISLSENNKIAYIEAFCVNLHLKPPSANDYYLSTANVSPDVNKVLHASKFLITEHVKEHKFMGQSEKDSLLNEFYIKYTETIQQAIWYLTDGLDSDKSFNKFVWPKYEASFNELNNWILNNKAKWNEIGLLAKKINNLSSNDTFFAKLKRRFANPFEEKIRLRNSIKKISPNMVTNYFFKEYLIEHRTDWFENPQKYIDALYNSKFNYDVVRLLENAGVKNNYGTFRLR